MKLPPIPLPDPVFMICLPHCEGRRQSAALNAARFLLWGAPTMTAEVLLSRVHGPHPVWLVLTATYLILAILVLLVGVRVDGESGAPS